MSGVLELDQDLSTRPMDDDFSEGQDDRDGKRHADRI
jgi:hypothetical protein